MKNTLITVITVMCLVISNITAYAQSSNYNNNQIDGVMTINEDLSADKNIIFENYCNLVSETANDYKPQEQDIQYDKALKTYWSMPLLEENELTRDVFDNFISLSGYMYDVPVYYENAFGSLILTRADDVESENRYSFYFSEDDSKIYANPDAHWCAQSLSEFSKRDYLKPIYDLLDDYGITDSEIFCVNTIGSYPANVLVIFRGNSEIAEFIVFEDVKSDGTIIPNTEFGERTYTYSDLKNLDAIYASSADIQQNAEGYSFISVENSNNLQYALIVGGVVLALTAAAGIILAVRKKKVKTAE